MAALTDIDPNIRTVAPRVKRARLARSINLIERSPARSPEERAELALLRSAELVRAAQGPGKKPRAEYLGEQWRKAWATPWGHGRLSQAPAILRSDVSSALFAASVVPATESKRGLSRAADRSRPSVKATISHIRSGRRLPRCRRTPRSDHVFSRRGGKQRPPRLIQSSCRPWKSSPLPT